MFVIMGKTVSLTRAIFLFRLSTSPSRKSSKNLKSTIKNTTVYGFAKELAVFKSFEIFPETFTQSDAKTLAVYFVYQARLALQESFNHALFFKSHQISDENIKNIVKKYHLDMYQG